MTHFSSSSALGLCCWGLLLALGACTSPEPPPASEGTFYLPYELTDPDAKYRLPGKLVEISGLSYVNDSTIACIQDEEGSFFLFDLKLQEVYQRIQFGKDGDYEGVEYVDGSVYTLRSSGKLYEVKAFGTENQETIKHKTPLEKVNNPEGLTYDAANRRLLISCKGFPGDAASTQEYDAIYAYDLASSTFLPKPAISFSVKDLYEFLGKSKLERVHDRATDFLVPGSIGLIAFAPSGIAIHPISGHIYTVTSQGNLMVVLSPEGELTYIRDLPPELFRQPEGIAFLSNGDLLISNEGQEGIANILRFNYIKQIE